MYHWLLDQVFEVLPRTSELLGELSLFEVDESSVRGCMRSDIERLGDGPHLTRLKVPGAVQPLLGNEQTSRNPETEKIVHDPKEVPMAVIKGDESEGAPPIEWRVSLKPLNSRTDVHKLEVPGNLINLPQEVGSFRLVVHEHPSNRRTESESPHRLPHLPKQPTAAATWTLCLEVSTDVTVRDQKRQRESADDQFVEKGILVFHS